MGADRDGPGLERTVAAICDAGGRAAAITIDLLDKGSAEKCVQAAADAFGGLDLLVTCAGVIYQHNAVETTDEEWDVILGTLLTAVFRCCRAAIPQMRARGGGAIVNIGSGWGIVAGPETVSYAVAKAGVISLTRALAIDHGPEGIRVNAVCPSLIDTPMLRGNFADRGLDPYDRYLAEFGNARPLRRWGRAEDVASAIAWLLSDESSYVSGGCVNLDGGSLAQGG
jgi:NAD(P)-dependent dehydrogenase (short-subunit alcohol dehydrogenase family)